MNYHAEISVHTRNKVKVVLDLPNCATKKNYNMLQALIHLIQLPKNFIAFQAEVDKQNIAKLVNVPTSLNNLKTKVDDLYVGKLKPVPIDFRKLSNVVDNQVVKNTKFNTLKTKINNLE